MYRCDNIFSLRHSTVYIIRITMTPKKYSFTNLELFSNSPKAGFGLLLIQKFAALVLPPSIAYHTAKNVKTLTAQGEIYEETRKKIIETFCQKDESGQPVQKDGAYQFPDPAVEKQAIAQIEELDQVSVELELMPIRLQSLEPVQGITGAMMTALLKLIEE